METVLDTREHPRFYRTERWFYAKYPHRSLVFRPNVEVDWSDAWQNSSLFPFHLDQTTPELSLDDLTPTELLWVVQYVLSRDI